jgi:hypothetical protein
MFVDFYVAGILYICDGESDFVRMASQYECSEPDMEISSQFYSVLVLKGLNDMYVFTWLK